MTPPNAPTPTAAGVDEAPINRLHEACASVDGDYQGPLSMDLAWLVADRAALLAQRAADAGDYASRLVLEIARRRYEATRCEGMLKCSSCPAWEDLSVESREGYATDWLSEHIRGAVDALAPAATEAPTDA